MPRLFVLSGDDIGRVIEIEGDAVLGRSKDVAVPLRSTSVSREHARIVQADGRWFVEDMGSRNGVHVSGERVPRAELEDGTVFVLGKLELRFRLAGADPDASAPAEPSFAPRPEPAAPPASDPMDVETQIGGIELEGEWSDEHPPPAPAPRITPAPAQAPPAKPKRAVDPKAAARAAALGGARPAERTTHSGKRILQYNRFEDKGAGLFGADLAQQSLPVRMLAYFLALALFAAFGYGAFKLTAKVRKQASDDAYLEEEAEIDR